MARWQVFARASLGAALGIALAVGIVAFVGRANRERGPTTPSPLPEAEGALEEISMHYVPRLAGVVEQTYADFLSQLSPGVRIRFVVPDDLTQSQEEGLHRRLDSLGASLWGRSTLVRTPGPITTWSKDRALVTKRTPQGSAWLVAPSEPVAGWVQRHNDWRTVASLASSSGGRYISQIAPFDFDSGDFAVLDGVLLVDANLIEKNRHRGIKDAATLERRLEAWFDTNVIVLGQRPGDTPPHHLSMYLSPLQGQRVLVGDPSAARAIVGDDFCTGDRSAETGKPLCADFSGATQQKFDRAAQELAARGYDVERIPNVPLEPKTYLAYTNGVYETRGPRRIAYVPRYGVEALDRAAREIYEALGWQVRPIRVRGVYAFHGTIGCLVNVLARGQAR